MPHASRAEGFLICNDGGHDRGKAALVELVFAGAAPSTRLELRTVTDPEIRLQGRITSCGPPGRAAHTDPARGARNSVTTRTTGDQRAEPHRRWWPRQRGMSAREDPRLPACIRRRGSCAKRRDGNASVQRLEARPPDQGLRSLHPFRGRVALSTGQRWGATRGYRLLGPGKSPRGAQATARTRARSPHATSAVAVLEPLHPRLDSSLVHATHPPLSYAAAAPVRLPNAPAGRLIAGFVKPPRDRAVTLWTAHSYAALTALHLTDPQALDELLARRDGLTGCLTEDGARHELDREIGRSARDGLQLSVCVIDLDNVKRVDDDLGHRRRNAMLALAAGIVRTSVRSCDTVGRNGGDGLIAILPQTNRDEAQQIATRLRSELVSSPAMSFERAPTPSLGVGESTPALQPRSCSRPPTVRCSTRNAPGGGDRGATSSG